VRRRVSREFEPPSFRWLFVVRTLASSLVFRPSAPQILDRRQRSGILRGLTVTAGHADEEIQSRADRDVAAS
jgi:hypothetical protein